MEETKQSLNVLIVEDSEDDALLLLRELKQSGYQIQSQRVDCATDMHSALSEQDWDLIITDHNMPGFSSSEALELATAHDINIPFILVSGSIGEEIAVDAMKSGAHDYVMKDNLTRLLPAIERELREAKNRRAHLLAQEEIHHMAFHDSLTGLVNRAEFESRLELAVSSARQKTTLHALLYIDLDQFKLVNDSCGHLAGDELLRRLSRRLLAGIRESDTLARLGGDEFAILLNDCHHQRMQELAQSLLDKIREYTFIWGDRTFKIGASIGLVQIDGSIEVQQLLSLADMACYAAKERGRNRIHIHTDSDRALKMRHGEMQWVQRLQSALNNHGLILYQQPIKALQGDKSHSELLLRMLDEDGSIIAPDRFIPAAERFNMMPQIDRWVIQHALEQISMQQLHTNNPQIQQVFINLSATSLSDDHLIEFIQQQLQKNKIKPAQIGFEITETAAIADFDCALNLINMLRKLGCKVALDDFGTGMSSFSYLKSLKVDFIKIDGGFVRAMLEDEMDQSIVESINKIGHVAGIKSIAEFVESAQIEQKLIEIGVDFAQGYAIQRPQPFSNLKLDASA